MNPGPRVHPRPPTPRTLPAAVLLAALLTPGLLPPAASQPATSPPTPAPAAIPPREANHDEARVPLHTLPDPLRMRDGSPVTTPEDLRFHLRLGRHDPTDVDWTHYLAFADQAALPWARAREITAAPRLNASQALRLPDAWFASPAAASLASNILSHQTPAGDWPKNLNTAARTFDGDPARLRGTFDNGASLAEIRFLARFHSVTARPAARDAARRAIEQILAAQYANGGWPQSHPPGPGYARHITFNDGVMTGLLGLLVEIDHSPDFAFLDEPIRARARQAVARGIDCILRCQVVVRGELTVWGAQHDAQTFEPRPARAFEPASLAAAESAGVLSFLMRLPHPTPAITRAIRAGRAWFTHAALPNLRLVRTPDDVHVIPTPGAPPLWARFYDLDANTPVFCGRDGVIRTRLEDIEQERRKGYAWYGSWGDTVAREFDRWAAQHPE